LPATFDVASFVKEYSKKPPKIKLPPDLSDANFQDVLMSIVFNKNLKSLKFKEFVDINIDLFSANALPSFADKRFITAYGILANHAKAKFSELRATHQLTATAAEGSPAPDPNIEKYNSLFLLSSINLVINDSANRTKHFLSLVRDAENPRDSQYIIGELSRCLTEQDLETLFQAIDKAKPKPDLSIAANAKKIVGQAMHLLPVNIVIQTTQGNSVRQITETQAIALKDSIRITLGQTDVAGRIDRAKMRLLGRIQETLEHVKPVARAVSQLQTASNQINEALMVITTTLDAKIAAGDSSLNKINGALKKLLGRNIPIYDGPSINQLITLLRNFQEIYQIDPGFQRAMQEHPFPVFAIGTPKSVPDNLLKLALILKNTRGTVDYLSTAGKGITATLKYYREKLAQTSGAHPIEKSRIKDVILKLQELDLKFRVLTNQLVDEDEELQLGVLLEAQKAEVTTKVQQVTEEAKRVFAQPDATKGSFEIAKTMQVRFTNAEIGTLAGLTRLNPYPKKSRYFKDWPFMFLVLPILWLVPKYIVCAFFRTKEGKFKHEVYTNPTMKNLIKNRENPYVQGVLLQMVLTNLEASQNNPRQIARSLFLLRKAIYSKKGGKGALPIDKVNIDLLNAIQQRISGLPKNAEVTAILGMLENQVRLESLQQITTSTVAQMPLFTTLENLAGEFQKKFLVMAQIAQAGSGLQNQCQLMANNLNDIITNLRTPSRIGDDQLTQLLNFLAEDHLFLRSINDETAQELDALIGPIAGSRYHTLLMQRSVEPGMQERVTVFSGDVNGLLTTPPNERASVPHVQGRIFDFCTGLSENKVKILLTNSSKREQLNQILTEIKKTRTNLEQNESETRVLEKISYRIHLETLLTAQLAALDQFGHELESTGPAPTTASAPAITPAELIQFFENFNALLPTAAPAATPAGSPPIPAASSAPAPPVVPNIKIITPPALQNLKNRLFEIDWHSQFNAQQPPNPGLKAALFNSNATSELRRIAIEQIFVQVNAYVATVPTENRPPLQSQWLNLFSELRQNSIPLPKELEAYFARQEAAPTSPRSSSGGTHRATSYRRPSAEAPSSSSPDPLPSLG
jgi:hypothetical protein